MIDHETVDATAALMKWTYAGDTDLDVYSEKSPLGSAILGHKVGDSTSYTLPNGKKLGVKILDAKPFTG